MDPRTFPLPFHILTRRLSLLLLVSTLLRQLLVVAETLVPDQQENVNFGYNREEPNRTSLPSSVECLAKHHHSPSNETTHGYRFNMSVGDGLFVFGFIGVLIVLKSLLTKITMVENKPENSDQVLSMDEVLPTYRITLQRHVDRANITITPPNSPCLEQTMSMSLIGSPISYSGNPCCTLSNFDRRCPYYGPQSLFSSPEGSAKCLV